MKIDYMSNKGKKMQKKNATEKKTYEFWTDQIARKCIERKKFSYLDKPMINFKEFTVKTSASISGVLHIGRLSDTIRGEAVARSFLDAGVDGKLIWVAEDMDPLRKVPEGVPKNFIEYIGMPVTDIPDPWGCHKNYAEHHTSKYFEVIDDFISLKMKKFSMRKEYKKGNFNPYVKKLMANVDELIKIQNKFRRTKLDKSWNPWTPICENCGKIITTKVTKVENGKVHYKCEDYKFEKNVAKGCGHEGINDPMKGNGKLMWKSEWAAQWARWKIVSEGAGKEYQVPGSAFWINAEICEKILGFPSPEPIFYEYLIINGTKMSASLGNVVYPVDWLKYAKPELLRLIFLKDPMRVRDFRWDILPNLMDEFDELEKLYYGKKRAKNERDEYNAKRLFEMINVKKLSKTYVPKFAFSTMIELVRTAPSDNQFDFIMKKVEDLGLIKKMNSATKKEIKERMKLAKTFVESLETSNVEKEKELLVNEKDAITKLIEAIQIENDADKLQNKIFEVAKESEMKPSKFFRLVYNILFSSNRGPRLGPYIIDAGKTEIIKKLQGKI